MTIFGVPTEIEEVFHEFRTCEFSTLAKDGTPITWPVTTFFQSEQGRFFMATSIGLPRKAFNIRRNPRVSMLFSDPTGSGLSDPPSVLVQGNAESPDEVITWSDEIEKLGRIVTSRQPAGILYSSNPVMRLLFDWYYMRLAIYVTPHRILWWDNGDFTRTPHELEVSRVE
ncbi:MAG: pyridoxamine 5'-phosphate oxidase family protein [Anaerolineales bacterium]|jgi:hypothetical protein